MIGRLLWFGSEYHLTSVEEISIVEFSVLSEDVELLRETDWRLFSILRESDLMTHFFFGFFQ